MILNMFSFFFEQGGGLCVIVASEQIVVSFYFFANFSEEIAILGELRNSNG